jgi:hypothetical protein
MTKSHQMALDLKEEATLQELRIARMKILVQNLIVEESQLIMN